jgi:hypothetical protein
MNVWHNDGCAEMLTAKHPVRREKRREIFIRLNDADIFKHFVFSGLVVTRIVLMFAASSCVEHVADYQWALSYSRLRIDSELADPIGRSPDYQPAHLMATILLWLRID